jgi:uncharacterized membrane protein
MTIDDEISALKARIARLERLAGLDPVVETPKPAPVAPAPPPALGSAESARDVPAMPPPLPPVVAAAQPPLPPAPAPAAVPSSAASVETWLARIGIGLVVIGVLLFLKLSLDRGWITPAVQMLVAAAFCLGFVVWGAIAARSRPQMGNLAFGGGLAGLFGVITASATLYELFSGTVAFALMAATAAVGLVQSLRRNTAALGALALIGAFAAPIFLESDRAETLCLHTVVVLAIALAMYFFRGWKSLLILGALGAFFLLLASIIPTFRPAPRVTVQLTILAAWAGLWLTPLARILSGRAQDTPSERSAVWLTAFLPALCGVVFSSILWWSDSRVGLGLAQLGVAALAGATGALLHRLARPALAAPQFVTAALFIALAIPTLLEGNPCWLTFAAFAVAMQVIARQTRLLSLTVTAHVAAAFLALFTLIVLAVIAYGHDGRWSESLTAFVMAAAFLAMGFICGDRVAVGVFRFAGHAALAGLILANGVGGGISLPVMVFLLSLLAVVSGTGCLAGGAVPELRMLAAILCLANLPLFLAAIIDEPGNTSHATRTVTLLGALGGFATLGLVAREPTERHVFLWPTLAGFLLWLWMALSPVSGGGLVSASWALTAIALLAFGLFRQARAVRIAGMITLTALVIRLFVVDLSSLDPLWKTVVFLGIGILLFAAGWILPKFLKDSV